MSTCIDHVKASVNFSTQIKKINSNTSTIVISAPCTSIWIFLNPQLFLSGFKNFSPSTNCRILIFHSEERIKKYPDSPNACERKPCIQKEKVVDSKISGYGWTIGASDYNR